MKFIVTSFPGSKLPSLREIASFFFSDFSAIIAACPPAIASSYFSFASSLS
jgi:hypothetical protein